jgi:hypothetical protein
MSSMGSAGDGAARGAAIRSDRCAATAGVEVTAGVEATGVSAGGEGIWAAAPSGCGGAGGEGAAGTWASVCGRSSEAGDGARVLAAFGSWSGSALAAPGELSFAVDAPEVVDAPDVVAGAVCFLVVAGDPAAGVLLAGRFCFLVAGGGVASPRVAGAPSPGDVVAAVGWSGVAAPAGSTGPGGTGAGSGAAASTGLVAPGAASGSSATVVEVPLASAAASSPAIVSPRAAADIHQPSASVTTTPAHAARRALSDAPGPLVGKQHPFADRLRREIRI